MRPAEFSGEQLTTLRQNPARAPMTCPHPRDATDFLRANYDRSRAASGTGRKPLETPPSKPPAWGRWMAVDHSSCGKWRGSHVPPKVRDLLSRTLEPARCNALRRRRSRNAGGGPEASELIFHARGGPSAAPLRAGDKSSSCSPGRRQSSPQEVLRRARLRIAVSRGHEKAAFGQARPALHDTWSGTRGNRALRLSAPDAEGDGSEASGGHAAPHSRSVKTRRVVSPARTAEVRPRRRACDLPRH
jgi:hypothetical protein